MVIALLLAGLIAVMLFAPHTPAARWLHGIMVEESLRFAEGLERKHLIFLVIGLFAIEAFAVAMPLDLAALAVWDVAIYLDVVIATSALSAYARVHSIKAWIGARARRTSRMRRRVMGVRRRRVRRASPPQSGANDDDPVFMPLLAAA